LEKWDNNEKGIIVSSNLIERLGYEIKKQLKINYMIDLSYKNQTISFSVPLKILAVADRLPHGDFIVSNGFSYNYQVKRSFNPFKKVQQFYVLASHGRKNELKTFTNKQFKYVENIVEINENRNDGKIKYRIEFEDIPSYEKKDFEALCRESSKYSIKEKLKNSGFVCLLDYYEWRNWEKASKNDYSDLVTLYLQEEYVDLLPELSLFLKENAGVEMDDSVINVFKNYHKDMARFKRISIILYLVLILLGIFISMAVYIKSVQATMHRLGVFSAFGVSPSFLSSVLAVESILIFLLSLLLAVGLHFIFPPILNHYGITTALIFSDILKVFLVGTFLCFIFVFFTVKFILKKQPYSLMNYRS
jgi:ABC-type antimicrobial peptide transport system permease subunit